MDADNWLLWQHVHQLDDAATDSETELDSQSEHSDHAGDTDALTVRRGAEAASEEATAAAEVEQAARAAAEMQEAARAATEAARAAAEAEEAATAAMEAAMREAAEEAARAAAEAEEAATAAAELQEAAMAATEAARRKAEAEEAALLEQAAVAAAAHAARAEKAARAAQLARDAEAAEASMETATVTATSVGRAAARPEIQPQRLKVKAATHKQDRSPSSTSSTEPAPVTAATMLARRKGPGRGQHVIEPPTRARPSVAAAAVTREPPEAKGPSRGREAASRRGGLRRALTMLLAVGTIVSGAALLRVAYVQLVTEHEAT